MKFIDLLDRAADEAAMAFVATVIVIGCVFSIPGGIDDTDGDDAEERRMNAAARRMRRVRWARA